MEFKNKEEELLYRVFKMIEESHFCDHKMIPWYCQSIKFDRGVGDDIGNYIQGKFPEIYHKKEKYHIGQQKERMDAIAEKWKPVLEQRTTEEDVAKIAKAMVIEPIPFEKF